MTTVTILGKLGKDVELKDINGTALAKFSVAQNVGFGDKKTTNWFEVSIWGAQAKSNFVDYLKKGQMVQVVGELSTREYNGKTYMEVRSYNCNLAGGQPQSNQNNQGNNQQSQQPRAQQNNSVYGQQNQGYQQNNQNQNYRNNNDLVDDLPF